MSKPETKTVLGRVFTWNEPRRAWVCQVTYGYVWLKNGYFNRESAAAEMSVGTDHDTAWTAATGFGGKEAAAILALQATLRKMAELEVVNG